MLRRIFVPILIVALIVLSATVHADDRLNGRSRLELRLGYGAVSASGADVIVQAVPPVVDISYNNNGYLGGLAFSKWIQEDLAVFVAITGLLVGSDVNIDFTGVSTSHVGITQMQLGMRYYLSGKKPTSSIRPFLTAAAGPIIGTKSETKVGYSVAVNSQQEGAVGIHLGTGIDIVASRKVMFGAEIGYNLITDFSSSLAGRKNYSGPDFVLSFGLLFGSAKDPG